WLGEAAGSGLYDHAEAVEAFIIDGDDNRTAVVIVLGVAGPAFAAIARAPQFDARDAATAGVVEVVFQGEGARSDELGGGGGGALDWRGVDGGDVALGREWR